MNKVIPKCIVEIGNDKGFCCICQDNIDKEDHFYPNTCIHSWCNNCHKKYNENTCPICRKKFREIILPRPRDYQINIVAIHPTQNINERPINRRNSIINCSFFCLLVNCIESMCLQYSLSHYKTFIRDFCWERTSCVYQTCIVSFFFTCENCKCKNIRLKFKPLIRYDNNEQVEIFCTLFFCLVFMICSFLFGRLCYLIINPNSTNYLCNLDWFILSAIIGIIVIFFYFVTMTMAIIIITQCLKCFVICFETCFENCNKLINHS